MEEIRRKKNTVIHEPIKKSSEIPETVSEVDFHIYSEKDIVRKVFDTIKKEDGHRWICFEQVPLQHPHAKYVALTKKALGLGTERYSFQCYELDADGCTIVGKPLVAKESCYTWDHDIANEETRKSFVNKFCVTQQLSRQIAEEFNNKIDDLKTVNDLTPKINFLDCSVYHLNSEVWGNLSALVEDRLAHNNWKKWNSNNGFVDGMNTKTPEVSTEEMTLVEHKLNMIHLGIIEKGEEDEISERHWGENYQDSTKTNEFTPSEVALAFSHFSYWATGRKRIICDLQGVYDEKNNVLKLSHPVIHYYNRNKEHQMNIHGRRDFGREGMNLFFATHKCSKLCHLVTRGFKVQHFMAIKKTLTNNKLKFTDTKTAEEFTRIHNNKTEASKIRDTVSAKDFYIYSNEDIVRKVGFKTNNKRDGQRWVDFKSVSLHHPHAKFVAVGKKAFGQGAERYVFQFYELGADGTTIVGKPFVAKESCYIMEHDFANEEERKSFVNTFVVDQLYCRRIANCFNDILDDLIGVDDSTPRVTFLDCSVYHLHDVDLGSLSVLVESCLANNIWKKWNSNNRHLESMKTNKPEVNTEANASVDHTLSKVNCRISKDESTGGKINEVKEKKKSELHWAENLEDSFENTKFTPSEVALAFSHFSYWSTGRLICDLQGVYDDNENILKFTDPVIHYCNRCKNHQTNIHGRRDCGRKGINLFFATHKCCKLCDFVTCGFKVPNGGNMGKLH